MLKEPILTTAAILLLSGCITATGHQESLPSTEERKITVGTVQKEVRQGMTQTEVAQVLGAPNIVSSDGPHKETWIYDKFSTETAYSTSSGGVNVLVFGWGSNAAGGVLPGYGSSSGAATRTQRTLTVIIRFDEGKVYDFSYHASNF